MPAQEYLRRILTARVYDVAIESPLERAPRLSERIGNRVLLKREDLQPVRSFKLRGAYNKMARLPREQLKRGVIAASAGNHAQGVALAAQKLGCRAVIVMPVTTPLVKVDAVRARDAEVVLFGDSYSDAYTHALELQKRHKLTFVHPFDDPDVIAGQGTIAMEILRQHHPDDDGPIHAVFVAIGGGGLIAGVASYIKALAPEIKVIGVQTTDSDAMARSLAAGRRVQLHDVGLFSDGTAVKMVGEETLRLCRQYVDEIVLVDTDAICAAIKDVFQDTRSILEPAGALAIAGMKSYAQREKLKGRTLVAIACGANMNFDRLRFVAERTEVGEAREALFAVTIPEERGSFKRFCELVGSRNVTEFNYRISDAARGAGVRRHRHRERRRQREDRARLPAARLRHGRPDARRPGRRACALHGWRQERAGRGRGDLPLRVPGAPGRTDEVPDQHGARVEHLDVPLPQPGRGLLARAGRPAGAARRAQGVLGLPDRTRVPALERDRQSGVSPVSRLRACTGSA